MYKKGKTPNKDFKQMILQQFSSPSLLNSRPTTSLFPIFVLSNVSQKFSYKLTDSIFVKLHDNICMCRPHFI